MIDIHTHILPKVDDGARSWEMAIYMCQMAAQDGTTHLVATPHANEEYTYDRAALQATLDELTQRVGPGLTFSLGCDFHFSYDNLALLEKTPEYFLISGTQSLMVELSDFSIPPWVTLKLQDLVQAGIRPIITHPERNLLLQRQPELVLRWVEIGCPVQVTANSLTGRWGEAALKTAQWLLHRHAVHIIASDCHNVESRPPLLSAAREFLAKNYSEELAQALVEENPRAVVENSDMPFFPPMRRKS